MTLAYRLAIAVLVVALGLYLEGVRTVLAAGNEVAGSWEAVLLIRGVPSIALVLATAVLFVVVAFSAFLPLLETRRGRVAWGVAASFIAAAVAVELSTGRKAQALAIRGPFVIGCVTAAVVLAAVLAPRLRASILRRPVLALPLGVALAAAAVVADARVLPRLYPVFHHALVAVAAIGAVLVAEAIVAPLASRPRGVRVLRGLSLAALVLFAFATWRTTKAGPALASFDNARRIVDERSLVLARASALGARVWPPRPLEDDADGPDPLVQSTTRALDATGRDVLLVTIDALRADHVGAYGYARPTTPALDRLAAEGVVFEHAYSPTPHTSYAVSSMMTGKYMRPVLALEAATGGTRRADETLAGLLRTYGFRTAAFYPPAVWAVDEDRFRALVDRALDFEYEKKEFAAPDLRAAQVSSYLDAAPGGKPLFLWVHLFEPHEPYVAHPAHDFGASEIDRYDSEIAAADAGLATIVAKFRAKRPGAIVIVSADHGEAFGEHGARYHGTTVYEEQVRVPLVVSAPGLVARRRVERPVQLVDVMPTLLSAYGIPRPPRVRGRDLGELLAQQPKGAPSVDEGIAFAEVEDQAMLARGPLRLVCGRKTAACAVYDVGKDPGQLSPLPAHPALDRMRKEMAALIGASAKLEGFAGSDAASWPEALRRAFAGDGDAAIEVTALLDDVDVAFRRRAAEVLARLARPETEEHVRRALGTETDASVRGWLAIARVRTAYANAATPKDLGLVAARLDEPKEAPWAALAIGEALARGAPSPGPVFQARAFEVLVEWFPTARSDGELGRSVLAAMPVLLRGSIGASSKTATPHLIAALGDVRLRVEAANAIGAIGDPAAIPELDRRLAIERHVDARVPQVLALARVGGAERAVVHLVRFLGVPEPPPGAAAALAEVTRLVPPRAWLATPLAAPSVKTGAIVPKSSAHRLVVIGPAKGATVSVKTLGGVVDAVGGAGGTIVELGDRLAKSVGVPAPFEVKTSAGKIELVAIVPRVDDLPPPKPDRTLEDTLEKGAPDAAP